MAVQSTDLVIVERGGVLHQTTAGEVGGLGGGGSLPVGGTTGQVLTKASVVDGDANWQTPSGGGGGFNPVLAWAY
jgi:hypothetical protein